MYCCFRLDFIFLLGPSQIQDMIQNVTIYFVIFNAIQHVRPWPARSASYFKFNLLFPANKSYQTFSNEPVKFQVDISIQTHNLTGLRVRMILSCGLLLDIDMDPRLIKSSKLDFMFLFFAKCKHLSCNLTAAWSKTFAPHYYNWFTGFGNFP